MNTLIDSHYSVETPEGVDLVMTPAGVCPRAFAYLIDVTIRSVVLFILGVLFSFAGDVGRGFMLMSVFLAEWFYPVAFEIFNDGVTPGKKSMGLKVLHDDGTPLSFSSSMLRNLLRVVDFMPVLYGAGLVSMASHPQFKRLGDLAAGTVVVYQDKDTSRQGSGAGDESESFTLPLEISRLSVTQQKLIVEFGERADGLSRARQAELAAILKPMIDSGGAMSDEAVIALLKQSADCLLGR